MPWTALPSAEAPWPYRLGYVLIGYAVHVAALAAGPALGARRYLSANPHCRACWVWLERETGTGGGAFTERDAARVLAALAEARYGELRELPVAERGSSGRSYSLRWWECQSCHGEAYVTCMREEGGGAGAPVLSKPVSGEPVRALRSLVAHRHGLADSQPPSAPQ